MAWRVEDKIPREERLTLALYFGCECVPVKMIDRRSHVRLPFTIGEDEPAGLGLLPTDEHSGRTICQWDDTPGILALAFSDPQKTKSSAVDRSKALCPPIPSAGPRRCAALFQA
jgi:hypothetical protein